MYRGVEGVHVLREDDIARLLSFKCLLKFSAFFLFFFFDEVIQLAHKRQIVVTPQLALIDIIEEGTEWSL